VPRKPPAKTRPTPGPSSTNPPPSHAGATSAAGAAATTSPVGRYAGTLAHLILGADEEARPFASSLRESEDFPQDVADSLATLAAGDRLGYAYAIERVLESFARRDEYLEDIPVADTVLVLQALAERRDIAADWADLAPVRAWWTELNAFDRIGDLTPPGASSEVISFPVFRALSQRAWALACGLETEAEALAGLTFEAGVARLSRMLGLPVEPHQDPPPIPPPLGVANEVRGAGSLSDPVGEGDPQCELEA